MTNLFRDLTHLGDPRDPRHSILSVYDSGTVDLVKFKSPTIEPLPTGSTILSAHVHNAVDFEGSPILALQIHLTHVEFLRSLDGVSYFNSFIRGGDRARETFRVPSSEYDPRVSHLKGVRKDGKFLVDENRLLPPRNPDLFEKVRGLYCEIIIGIKEDNGEES